MKNTIRDLLNQQIANEFEAAYMYLEFSNFFDSRNLDGYSNYYKIQAKEEIAHAMRIYKYMHQNNEKVKLIAIRAFDKEFENVDQVLETGLQAEKDVTRSIDNIFETSLRENDFRTAEFIKWFVNEQAEEERDAQKMIDEKSMFGNSLYELDNKYGKREYHENL